MAEEVVRIIIVILPNLKLLMEMLTSSFQDNVYYYEIVFDKV